MLKEPLSKAFKSVHEDTLKAPFRSTNTCQRISQSVNSTGAFYSEQLKDAEP